MTADIFQSIPAPDLIVAVLVVGARFLVPLLIPRYPLPAILAALAIDAADQTIFQTFTTLPLGGYQSYDKALDVYYLTTAYISTLRNWTNAFAFELSRFLFYYRLVGVALFEFTGLRPLLLFFPNTFEYFFIFYEVVRLRWDPRKISSTVWLGAAAAIWVFVKVPQEYWVHIAQLDVTDVIFELMANAELGVVGLVMQLWPLLLLGAVALAVVGLRALRRRLPPADYAGWRVVAPAIEPRLSAVQMGQGRAEWSRQIFDRDLLEKVVLITLLTFIFAHILPNFNPNYGLLAVAIAAFVVANTAVTHALARRNLRWSTWLLEFGGLLAINSLLAYLIGRLLPGGANVPVANALFLVLLLTVIIALFDHYQQLRVARLKVA